MPDPAPTPARRLQPATVALVVAALIAGGVLLYTIAFRGSGGGSASANTTEAAAGTNAMAPDGQVASVQQMVARGAFAPGPAG